MTSPRTLTSGPTRIARIDGRIGLDEVLDAALAPTRQSLERPALGAHDAGGDREGEPLTQRVTDRQHPFAHPGVVAVAQGHRRQALGVDLEHGHVGIGVGSDDLGLELTAVEQPDRDLLGTLDHVIVGQDVAVGGDHETGTAALLDVGLLPEPGKEPLHARRDPLRRRRARYAGSGYRPRLA